MPVAPVPFAVPNPMTTNGQTAQQSVTINTAPRPTNFDMSDPERTLYKGFWPKRGICCCQGGASSSVAGSAEEGEVTNTNSNTSLDKKAFKIEVTDTDVIYTTRSALVPCACCFGGCRQINTKTSALDGLTNLVVNEDQGAGCCAMILM